MGAIIHHMLDRAPAPVAPFSHAVETDGWVFVTGQIPENPGQRGRTASGRHRGADPPRDGQLEAGAVGDRARPRARCLGPRVPDRHAGIRDHEQDLRVVFPAQQAARTHLHRRDRIGQGSTGRNRFHCQAAVAPRTETQDRLRHRRRVSLCPTYPAAMSLPDHRGRLGGGLLWRSVDVFDQLLDVGARDRRDLELRLLRIGEELRVLHRAHEGVP